MSLELIILLANIFFFILGLLIVPRKYSKAMILPFLLIPLFVYFTGNIKTYIDIDSVDKLLLTVYGGVLMGLGSRLIYKEKSFASGSDVVMLITREISKSKRYIVNYAFDLLWIIIGIALYGFEGAMYSLIAIIIIESLSRRAVLGVSDSKVFYIITKKEKEVRDYIIDELNYELTVFDVKGGFLKTKNKVLMSVIPTKDYYKLREGIKLIDPKAFISITDSYEVINQDRHSRKENIKL